MAAPWLPRSLFLYFPAGSLRRGSGQRAGRRREPPLRGAHGQNEREREEKGPGRSFERGKRGEAGGTGWRLPERGGRPGRERGGSAGAAPSAAAPLAAPGGCK